MVALFRPVASASIPLPQGCALSLPGHHLCLAFSGALHEISAVVDVEYAPVLLQQLKSDRCTGRSACFALRAAAARQALA